MIFNDLLISKDGMIKGPFGSAVKKSLFIPKGSHTYKVYEQGVVANDDFSKGNYYLDGDYVESKLSRFLIEPGDILMTGAGTLGLLTEVPVGIEPGVMNQALIRIRLNEDVIYKPYFKYYFPWAIKDYASRINGNSVIPNLPPLSVLKEIEVELPSMEMQKQVADKLDLINKKINLNNSIVYELEEMAKTIYDYWFLQFDFPDENGNPYRSSGGKMVWNNELKREIPEGFNLVDINNVCSIVDCLHSKKPEKIYESDAYYLLGLNNITKEGYIDLTDKYYISKAKYDEWISRIEVVENDFVVTNAGRAGDFGMIPHGVKCAIGRNITAIRAININPYYLRQFFKSQYTQMQIVRNLDSGSFFMSYNVKSIKKLKILIPTTSSYNKASIIFKSIIIQIEHLVEENQQLTSLRDFLLPLLMNGQVTIE